MSDQQQASTPAEALREYRLPVDLLQGIVNYLNTRPCIEVRGLINAIEVQSVQQDLEHQAAQQKPSRRKKVA